MNTLRIVLIIIGIVFIAGIYFFQRKKTLPDSLQGSSSGFIPFVIRALARIKIILKGLFVLEKESSQKPASTNRSFEKLSNEQLENMSNMIANKASNDAPPQKNFQIKQQNDGTRKAISVEPGEMQGQAVTVSKGEELLITLTFIPKSGHGFTGEEIILACKSAGLQLGELNIFHRYALVDDKVQITPVCSLVNSFEPGYFELETMPEFSTEGLSLFMQLPGPVDGREAFSILMDVSEKLSINLNAKICDETRSVLTTQTISHLKEKVENYRFKLKMDSLKNH